MMNLPLSLVEVTPHDKQGLRPHRGHRLSLHDWLISALKINSAGLLYLGARGGAVARLYTFMVCPILQVAGEYLLCYTASLAEW
jgi:hypothetical protein